MNEWILIIIAIAVSGFFSGSEIAFVTANRLKLEIETRRHSFAARALNNFTRNPDSFLITTLVGNNIVNVIYATLMTFALTGPIISWLGPDTTEITLLIIQTVIASVIIMIFGEILPKAVFRIHSDSVLRLIAIPQQICNWLLKPIIVVADLLSSFIISLFDFKKSHSENIFRRQDLEMILKEIKNNSSTDLDEDDSEILHNVLELSEKRVKESMIPRTEIVAIEKNTKIDEVLRTFISSGYSKLPVYQESIDDIIGVVFAHDMFKNPDKLADIIRSVKLVPSSQRSKDLLSEFRQSNTSVAIVIDEYGGTAGMVTIEDLLEEVVGDIQDEYDTEETHVKKLAPNKFMVSGNIEIEELREEHPEIMLPDYDNNIETLAGYIINNVGRIPTVNEELIIDNHKFIICKATPNKIETVKIILMD